MIDISINQILKIFKTCKSEEEFRLQATIRGVEPESLMNVLNSITKDTWKGQWLNNQENRSVTINEFFNMKESGKVDECSSMNDLCKQMCYLVKYS